MKKFLLRPFLAGNELNVVDEQDVNATVLVSELFIPIILYGVDQFICKLFRRSIEHFRIWILVEDVMSDCMHQMGLPQTDAAVNEQGIVRERGSFGNGQRGCVGQLVAASLDVSFKGIFWIQYGGPCRRFCLLYTSDAADDLLCVDLGGRRII